MSSILLHLALSFAILGLIELFKNLGMPINIRKIYSFIPILNICMAIIITIIYTLAMYKKVILIRICDKYFICFNHRTNRALGFFTDKMLCMHIDNMDSFRSYLKRNINNRAEVLATMLTCRDMLKDRRCLGNVNVLWNNENNMFVMGGGINENRINN